MDWRGTRVAVTGAGGFVGRALTAELLARGAAVRGLSRGDPPGGAVTWVRGGLGDREALAALVEGAAVVVHAAAWVHRRPRSAADLADLRATNVDGTEALVRACSPELRALVLVSSTAVYGASPGPWEEATACRPTTPYGESKLEAERIVLACPRGGVVRPSAVVGDGAPGSLDVLDRAVRLGVVPVVDGGSARKSLTHVSTVVAACLALAERLALGPPADRIVVATDDRPYTVAEVARWRAGARGVRLVSVPRWLLGALPVARGLLATLAGDAVASNARLRAMGVVPRPTAEEWLVGGAR